uniref:Uncharacterized protein n=1 Tax=Arundo donax TaxID=35708 RepID=A0A0A9B6K2_ARUDO
MLTMEFSSLHSSRDFPNESRT